MSTNTPNLGLVKPAGAENWSRTTYNGNLDLIDAAAVAFTICTSSTRPSTTHAGQAIYETDTGNRLVRNAANSAWIPMSPYQVADATAKTALGSVPDGFITYQADTDVTYLRKSGAWVDIRDATPNPTFVGYQNAAQTLATSTTTYTAITLNVASESSLMTWSSGTNPSRVTPLVAGLYSAQGQVSFAGSGTGVRYAQIRKNGAILLGYAPSNRANNIGAGFSVQAWSQGFVRVNGTTDYVELYGRQDSGGNLNTFYSATDPDFSWLSLTYVGV